MKIRYLVGAALACVFAAPSASADPAALGWYGAIDLGGHARQDAQTPSAIPELGYKPAAPRFQTIKDFAGFARLGYRVLPHLRIELEAGWRPAAMRQIVDEYQNGRPLGSITRICGDAPIPADLPPNCGPPAGSVDSWTAMGNVIADFWRLNRPQPRILPFAGLGVGIAHVRLQAEGRLFGPTPPGRIVIDDADNKVALQAFAGLAMRITDQWTADLAYRFLYSGPHSWNTTTFSPIQLGRITGKYEDHALTLGLRYRFSSPLPPAPTPPPALPAPSAPPPPPSPREAQTSRTTKAFIVYLPFDQYVLTPDAHSVAEEGARYATVDKVSSHVGVVGYTDTSGGFAHNVRPPERWAKATADQLVADGVAQSVLDVGWKGFTEPAVQTAPGAKAFRNRLAVIDVDF